MDWWILLWLLAAVIIYGAMIYNRLAALRQEMQNAVADMEMRQKIDTAGALAAKKYFESTAMEYNKALQGFPAALVAKLFKLKPEDLKE